jgi:HK97 gp10 family phage protein
VASFVELIGFKEMDQALAELPKATGKNVLRRIARGALEPMANAAAAKAPTRTGRLAYSISVSEKRTSRAKWQSGKFRSAASTGITMAMGPASGLGTLQYASFDEFGTVDTPAFAYMRAAWDGGAYQALDYVKANLRIAIKTAAAKVARKRAKALAA